MLSQLKLLLIGGIIAGTATLLYFMFGNNSFKIPNHPLVEKYQNLLNDVEKLGIKIEEMETCSQDEFDLIDEYTQELNMLNEEKWKWSKENNLSYNAENFTKDLEKKELEEYMKEKAHQKLFDPFASSSQNDKETKTESIQKNNNSENIFEGGYIPQHPDIGSQTPEILPDKTIPELRDIEPSNEQPGYPNETKTIPELRDIESTNNSETKEEFEIIDKTTNYAIQIKNTLNLLKNLCEEKKPEEKTKNACKKACENYVTKCLSLIPNVNQAIINDGLSSCIKECKQWKKEKISCMEKATSCEVFADMCGL